MSKKDENLNTNEEDINIIDDVSDDIIFDDEATPKDQTKKLREKLAKCVEEKQEYLDGWQRAKADLVNAKKRLDEEKKSFAAFATENVIQDLLPVLDSFDMAMKDKEAWESAPEGWRKGVEYIHTQLTSSLENHGVTTIDPLHQEFDANTHDPLETIPVEDEKQDNKVMEVIMKGYSLRDKNLRAPKVKVGKLKN